MDTPGHVDFAYEVSRSLAACEGSLLVVDASQGVEAQTLANVYQAIDAGHEIVPVLNKIDLPAAEPERVKEQIEEVIGLDASGAIEISAKTGLNIDAVLEALVTRLPPPKGDAAAPLKALLVDSWYDSYLGVVILVRVKDGVLEARPEDPDDGDRRRASRSSASASSRPKQRCRSTELDPGEIGFITAGIKTVADCKVGDTITEDRRPAAEPLPGFKPLQPVVFCGLFPTDSADYEHLRDCLAKLRLNDASFEYEPETSAALGFGFRCGFLGLLASRNHPGAARARIRSRPDRHRAVRGLSRPSHQRRGDAAPQSGRHARPGADRPYRGAVDQGHHPGARRLSRRHPHAVRGAARRAEGPHLCRQPRHGDLSPAAERSGVRFLRPAQIGEPRLCQLRLPDRRLPAKAISC